MAARDYSELKIAVQPRMWSWHAPRHQAKMPCAHIHEVRTLGTIGVVEATIAGIIRSTVVTIRLNTKTVKGPCSVDTIEVGIPSSVVTLGRRIEVTTEVTEVIET